MRNPRHKPDHAKDVRRDERARIRDACERIAAQALAANNAAQRRANSVYANGYTPPEHYEARGKVAPAPYQKAHVDEMRKWGAKKAAKTRSVSHYAKKYGVDDAALRVRMAAMLDKLRANGVDV